MDEPTGAPDATDSLRHTPELPKRLTDLTPVVMVGTTLWLGALIVLFFVTHGVWVQTALAGVVLGLIGFGIIFWQRAAARRGSKSAQRL